MHEGHDVIDPPLDVHLAHRHLDALVEHLQHRHRIGGPTVDPENE
jgi:hypothetical protein